MVTSIDAVHYGLELDDAGRWHQTKRHPISLAADGVESLNIGRGILWGLLLSGILWIGLIGAARALLGLLGS